MPEIKTATGTFTVTEKTSKKILSITISIEGPLTLELVGGIERALNKKLPQPYRVSAIHPALVFDLTECEVPPKDAPTMAKALSLMVACNEGLARKIRREQTMIADVSILVMSVNDPFVEALMGQDMGNYLKVVGGAELDFVLLYPPDATPIAISAQDFCEEICPHCGKKISAIFCRSKVQLERNTICYKCPLCFNRFLTVEKGTQISSIGFKFIGKEGEPFSPEVQPHPFLRGEK